MDSINVYCIATCVSISRMSLKTTIRIPGMTTIRNNRENQVDNHHGFISSDDITLIDV